MKTKKLYFLAITFLFLAGFGGVDDVAKASCASDCQSMATDGSGNFDEGLYGECYSMNDCYSVDNATATDSYEGSAEWDTGAGDADSDYDADVDSYDGCMANWDDIYYCAGKNGTPTEISNLVNAASVNCYSKDDCPDGKTCYQYKCIEDETLTENTSLWERTTNSAGMTWDSLTSSSSNSSSSKKTSVVKTNQDMVTSDGKKISSGSTITQNSDGTATATTTSGETVTIPASDASLISASAYGGGSLTLCANGIIGQVCQTSAGSSPVVVVSGGSSSGSSDSSGIAGVAGLSGANVSACGANFESIGGVCFPTRTGLSSAPIYLILSNIFSWLMGLFTTFAVLAFVISGIQYLTSAGDTDQIETAKRNAKWSLIGIVVGLSGFVIVKAIAGALSGQSIFF